MSLIIYQLWVWVASLLWVFPLQCSNGCREVEPWSTSLGELAELSFETRQTVSDIHSLDIRITCFTVLWKFWNTLSFTMRLSSLFNGVYNPSFWTLSWALSLSSFTFPISSSIPSFQKKMKTSFSLPVYFSPFISHPLHFFPPFLFLHLSFQSAIPSVSLFLSSSLLSFSFLISLIPLSSLLLLFLWSCLSFFLFFSLLALLLSCGSQGIQTHFSQSSGEQIIWETHRRNLHLLTQKVVAWLFWS